MTEKTVNYTPDQVAQMLADYASGVRVETIAENLGKTTRSVVAKLSREGVYQPKAKATTPRVTKEDLVGQIEARFGFQSGELNTFEKASKEQLEALIGRF